MKRLTQEGRADKAAKWNFWKVVRTLFTNKYIYLLVSTWSLLNLALGASHVLGIVAKRSGYDAIAANLFTTVRIEQ